MNVLVMSKMSDICVPIMMPLFPPASTAVGAQLRSHHPRKALLLERAEGCSFPRRPLPRHFFYAGADRALTAKAPVAAVVFGMGNFVKSDNVRGQGIIHVSYVLHLYHVKHVWQEQLVV